MTSLGIGNDPVQEHQEHFSPVPHGLNYVQNPLNDGVDQAHRGDNDEGGYNIDMFGESSAKRY